jgi:hypothetical protein
VVHIFYEGLEQSSKLTIDDVAGGNLMNMDAWDTYKLIDEMIIGQQQWNSMRGPTRGVSNIIETDTSVKLAA